MGIAVAVILLITVWEYLFYGDRRRLLGCSGNSSSFIFARTSYTSRQRKLAVSAIVRPWAISFVRSLNAEEKNFVRQVAERRRKK